VSISPEAVRRLYEGEEERLAERQTEGENEMPKFLGLLHADAASEAEEMPPAEMFEKMGVLMEEITKAGVMLSTDGLKATKYGKRVIAENGETRVIDGPFTESKELIASYALYQCKDIDEAVYWTKRFLDVLGSGTCEIRPIFEFDDFPSELFPPEEVAKEAALREEMTRNADKPI
jgi:hypothetical protein